MSKKRSSAERGRTVVRVSWFAWLIFNIMFLGIPWFITKGPKWLRTTVWVLINIPTLGIPAILLGGPKKLWNEFFSYALGTYKQDRDTGEILWIRFCTFPDWIHFHWMVWGGLLLAGLQGLSMWANFDHIITPFGLAYVYLILFAITLMAVYRDTPFWSFIKLLALIAVVIGADFGIRLGMGKLDGFINSLAWNVSEVNGVTTAEATQWYWVAVDWTVGWVPHFLKWGIIKPVFWDFPHWLKPETNIGFLILLSIGWAGVIARPAFMAVMRNRKEIDRRNLIEKAFGEKEEVEPVYMRQSALTISDVFEAGASFADVSLKVQGGTKTFKNVFGGSWWLRIAFNKLRLYKTPQEREEEQARQAMDREHEDAAELVEPLAQTDAALDRDSDHEDSDHSGPGVGGAVDHHEDGDDGTASLADR